jgi:hypothetical protein
MQNPREQRTEAIVHRFFQVLLAAEVSLGRQDRSVAQEKLDLLKLTSIHVAELRTSSPQVMRREVIKL